MIAIDESGRSLVQNDDGRERALDRQFVAASRHMNMHRSRVKLTLVASLTIAFLLSCGIAGAQDIELPSIPDDPIRESDTAFPYRMFGTKNMWTFVLLDTTNGRAWQVQYSVDESPTTKWVINELSLLPDGATPTNGRFTLYSTDNIYNLLLLDRLDGRIWQLQWSTDAESRGIMRYIPGPD